MYIFSILLLWEDFPRNSFLKLNALNYFKTEGFWRANISKISECYIRQLTRIRYVIGIISIYKARQKHLYTQQTAARTEANPIRMRLPELLQKNKFRFGSFRYESFRFGSNLFVSVRIFSFRFESLRLGSNIFVSVRIFSFRFESFRFGSNLFV